MASLTAKALVTMMATTGTLLQGGVNSCDGERSHLTCDVRSFIPFLVVGVTDVFCC